MAALASSLSPAASAASTCLTKVRMRLTRAPLISVRRVVAADALLCLRRIRHRQCLVSENEKGAASHRTRSRRRPLRGDGPEGQVQRWQRGQKKVERPESTRRRIVRAAVRAWLPFPAIDPPLLRKIAELAVRLGIIAKRRAAGLDRGEQHRPSPRPRAGRAGPRAICPPARPGAICARLSASQT